MNTNNPLAPLPKDLMTKFNSMNDAVKETSFLQEKSLDSMRDPSTLKLGKSQ